MTFYWDIIPTQDYIDQLSSIDIGTQIKIEKCWMEVASTIEPLNVGSTATCPQGRPYVLVIFPGLAYEFLYRIDRDNKAIHLINCRKLTFLDYGQSGQI